MGANRSKDISPKRKRKIIWYLKNTEMTQKEIGKKVSVSQHTVYLIRQKMKRGEDVLSSKRGNCGQFRKISPKKRAAIERHLDEGIMKQAEIAKKVLVSKYTVCMIKQKMDRGEKINQKMDRDEDVLSSKRRKFGRKPKDERLAIRQKNTIATASSQIQPVAKCSPSITNVADTPTTKTTRTDVTHDETIYLSAKSDGHRLRSPIRGRSSHSCDQSLVNDNAESPNAENDNACEVDDTFTSPSVINFPNGAWGINSSESGSSRDEESSKTLVEDIDASASSKDSLVVMAYGSSRFDSSGKMSPISRRRPVRHEQSVERPRGNTDSVNEPTLRDVRVPFSRHDDEVLVTSTARPVSPATIQKRKRAQILSEAMNHLKGFVEATNNHLEGLIGASNNLKSFVEKFETVIGMAAEDQVI